MILAVTGHRPNKLGNEYTYKGIYSRYIADQLIKYILQIKPDKCISGMALGVDTIFASICIYLAKTPLIAAIPFEGQESKWLEDSVILYNKILDNPLTEKHYICEPGYSPKKMQKRNEWMVDHCDILLAVWDGTPGGTANCVKYAKRKRKRIIYIDPKEAIKH